MSSQEAMILSETNSFINSIGERKIKNSER